MPRRGLLLAASPVVAALGTSASQASTPSVIVFSATRTTTLADRIYRVDPDGRRVDLGRGSNPVVSPNGRRIAFRSSGGVSVVGIDGRGQHLVGPSGDAYAWQPHGRRLAIGTSPNWPAVPTVSVVRTTGSSPRIVRRAGALPGTHPWSPDGRVLLVAGSRKLLALAPDGHVLWVGPHGAAAATWSSRGHVATIGDASLPRLFVYDETGHELFHTSVGDSGETPTWSPDGRRLAIIDGLELKEWNAAGKRVRFQRLTPSQTDSDYVAWSGEHGLVLVPYGSRWLAPRSANGKLAIVTAALGSRFALGVGPPGGSSLQRYALVPTCFDQGGDPIPTAGSLQFAGRSIVYESWGGDCSNGPPANLYSVSAGGGRPHRLTRANADELEPVLSPDGTEIAYAWSATAWDDYEGGQTFGIRIAGADGRAKRMLTRSGGCVFTADCATNVSPTWSPDGKTLLYVRTTADNGRPELVTIPAGGGKAHPLDIEGFAPAWGPLRRIAYETLRPHHPGTAIWTANPDGRGRIEVSVSGSNPAWSSDGRLAFLRPGPRLVIAGSSPVQLPFAHVTSLAWSPDGTRLALAADGDVWTIEPDGTDPVRLTTNYDASGVSWR